MEAVVLTAPTTLRLFWFWFWFCLLAFTAVVLLKKKAQSVAQSAVLVENVFVAERFIMVFFFFAASAREIQILYSAVEIFAFRGRRESEAIFLALIQPFVTQTTFSASARTSHAFGFN